MRVASHFLEKSYTEFNAKRGWKIHNCLENPPGREVRIVY